jgi:hypothetical protein
MAEEKKSWLPFGLNEQILVEFGKQRNTVVGRLTELAHEMAWTPNSSGPITFNGVMAASESWKVDSLFPVTAPPTSELNLFKLNLEPATTPPTLKLDLRLLPEPTQDYSFAIPNISPLSRWTKRASPASEARTIESWYDLIKSEISVAKQAFEQGLKYVRDSGLISINDYTTLINIINSQNGPFGSARKRADELYSGAMKRII